MIANVAIVFFFQAEDGIRDGRVTGVQTCALPIFLDPPCAVCAGGEQPPLTNTEIQVGGSASITASLANGAEYCAGVNPTAAAYSQGSINTNGHPSITGPVGGSDTAPNQPTSNFSNFLFSDSDILTLKSLAKASGTYYQGDQHWSSPPPNGIIFVDTPS